MEVRLIEPYSEEEHRVLWSDYGMELPKFGVIYTVRGVDVSSVDGDRGFYLVEIISPPLRWIHPVFGYIEKEPSFSVEKFVNLAGKPFYNRQIQCVAFTPLPTPFQVFTNQN